MRLNKDIVAFHDEMTDWRRDIHRHPEIAFEERRTSDFVAAKLEAFGLEVHRGLAKTGVVGTLRSNSNAGACAIGLRADMDALPLQERNTFDYRSVNDGKMHACGHDGHTAMLLGAARLLAKTREFEGTIHFIFQPAEETGFGGRDMVREGLFDRFPMAAVYGMHNFPGIEVGRFAMRKGPLMAATDTFELTIKGVGGHGAFPHTTHDPIVTAAQVISAWQTITSRETDPLHSAVVSVTQFHGGDTTNVIPEEVVLAGTTRSFDRQIQDGIESAMKRIADGLCSAMRLDCVLRYERGNPTTVNSDIETDIAAAAAARVVGEENVDTDTPPIMGGEDFAWMLREKPGCYVLVGNGTGSDGGCMLHNPQFDFNDAILPIGASYWVELVRAILPRT
jgi:hippurate hydrolase